MSHLSTKTIILIYIISFLLVLLVAGGVFFARQGKSGTEDKPSIVSLGKGDPLREEQPSDPSQIFQDEASPNRDDLPTNVDPTQPETASPIAKKPQATARPKNQETMASLSPSLAIQDAPISWGFESPATPRSIDAIIIHSSYDAIGKEPYDKTGLLEEYQQYGVSAHYLIDRGGKIYRLVSDKLIAYHAGKSMLPNGKTNVNERSIGIELMNTEKDAFTEKQYAALNGLIAHLKQSYGISYVLGHDQVAPGRKTDPWNIEWGKVKK